MSRHIKLVMAVAICTVACGKSERDDSRTAPVAASGGSASPGGSERIEIPSQLSASEREGAQHAKEAFLAACAASRIDWSEFQEVSLSTSTALGYLKDKYDWELVVTVALTYKDGLDQRRGGHRLTFDMGAGRRPGIVTRKSHGIKLCGFDGRAAGVSSGKPCDPDGGEDCILDVPGLSAIDASRSPAVVSSDRTAPPAWCFAHGFDPPAFWKCASTEKTCKKARAAEKREENDDYRVRTECLPAASLHCFTVDSGATACAPDAASCVTSRKEWTNRNTATACDVATPEMLTASNAPD